MVDILVLEATREFRSPARAGKDARTYDLTAPSYAVTALSSLSRMRRGPRVNFPIRS